MRADEKVTEALARARLTPSGWWVAECPFCADKTGTPGHGRKLGVREDTGIFHCFRCHAKGKIGRGDQRDLERRASALPDVDRAEATRPPPGFWALSDEPGASAASLAPARAYLARRGVSSEVIRAAGLGACATGKYGRRVVVPVHDAAGAWAGFVARTWLPKDAVPAPYLYPQGMDRGGLVYNASALAAVTEVPVVVVEGAFDCFPLWPDAVALFGTASAPQVARLAAAPRPVAVVLDGDAWVAGWALALQLRLAGQRAGSVRLPPRTDPDEVPAHKLWEACWAAIEAPDAVVDF